jgi:hypothetical protein
MYPKIFFLNPCRINTKQEVIFPDLVFFNQKLLNRHFILNQLKSCLNQIIKYYLPTI